MLNPVIIRTLPSSWARRKRAQRLFWRFMLAVFIAAYVTFTIHVLMHG